ncbi:SWIM zinc finger family protein [Elizabethkingia meningoseptica]
MKITIDNFENFIEPKIIKRGLEYYEEGVVENFNEIAREHYIANIVGTDDYEIEIQLEDGEITAHFCTCPYDYGEFCKHEVAVLYTILEKHHVITIEPEPEKVGTKKSKASKNDITVIIEKISHQELKDFVLRQAASDKNFKQTFLLNFASLTGEDTFHIYRKQIENIIRSGAGRNNFIGYYEMRDLGKKLMLYIDEAARFVDHQEFHTAFDIAAALLDKSVEFIERCDDSDGYMTSITDGCFDIFESIVLTDISEDLRKEILQYCIKSYDSGKFSGWDWHEAILILTLKLIKNIKEAEEILKRITGNYNENKGQEKLFTLKYDILLKWKSKEHAKEFLYANLRNPELRKKAINNAINDFNYEEAKKLASDGMQLNKVNFPGLKKTWANYLLKIAEKENDISNVILYARYLLIDNFYPKRDYYEILKEYVSKENWETFVDELVSDILKSSGYYGRIEQVADIYIKEKRWGSLLELLRKASSIHLLEDYEKHIVAYFPDEIVKIYIEFIVEGMKNASDRSHYKSYCTYLKKIKKMGFVEKAQEMVENFKLLYPKRKAMLDELSKV